MTKEDITHLNESSPPTVKRKLGTGVKPAVKGRSVVAIPPVSTPAGVTAAAIKDQAIRLGISWEMHAATVVQPIPTSVPNVSPLPASKDSFVSILLDGDTVAIQAISVIGSLGAGARVMVIQVPPSGFYVIGVLGGTAQRNLVYTTYIPTGAALTLTTSPQTVITQTVPVTGAFWWEAWGNANTAETVTGTTAAILQLTVAGVVQTGHGSFNYTAGGQGATIGWAWGGFVNLTSDSQVTFILQALKSINAGTVVTDTNDSLLINIYQ